MSESTTRPGSGLPKQAHGANGQEFNLQTVIVALRCWWKVATPVGLLLAVGAAFVIFYITKPKYTASAWIMIRERAEMPFGRSGNPESPLKAIQNHLELLRSPTVTEPVAAIPAVSLTPELQGAADPVETLRKQLKIRAIGRSDYYVIEFTSVSPEKAALVSNEVTRKFLDLHQVKETERTSKILKLLKDLAAQQQATVKTMRDAVQSLSKQVTGKGAFDVPRKDEPAQKTSLVGDLQSQLIKGEVDNLVLRAQVQAEEEMLEKVDFTVRQADIDQFVDSDREVILLRTRLAQNRHKIAEHERTSTNLAKNTGYQQLQKQVADDQAALEKLISDLEKNSEEEIEQMARRHRKDQLDAMKSQVGSSEFRITFLKERLGDEMKNLKEFTGDSLQLEFMRSDYDRAMAVHNAIADRIMQVEQEQKAPIRVETVREAVVPTAPDEAIPFKKMLLAAMCGFIFPFGLAVGIEFLYRRVTDREQLERGGRINVVGEISILPTRGSAKKRTRRRAHLERQLFEESIDGLRTYLALDHSLNGLRVLAVTSAVSGEGKTSLASQLAVSLASATGSKTLLIDGDMRSPDVHRIFDIERGPGLAEVLKGECTVDDAIETGFSETVHLMPAGVLTNSPHRLLGNGAFSQLLESLAGKYTYVVVDTPPILPASEALVLARAADAAVLCVRRDYSRLWQVATAFGRLQGAGVRTAGAVLNGIAPRTYTYRYGAYYYARRFEQSQEADASKN